MKAGKQSAVFLSFQTSTQEEDARVLWLCAGRRASLQKTNEEDQVNSLPYGHHLSMFYSSKLNAVLQLFVSFCDKNETLCFCDALGKIGKTMRMVFFLLTKFI